ncbi:MAG: GGDEF domain-containing protein [Actinobacteria bacterium]|nr:GGDEF domain-containing protein [Actinomycetota bacterium]
MARDDVTARAASRLDQLERNLAQPAVRLAVLLSVLAVTVGLHAATEDPRWVWLAALPALLAGLVGGAGSGLVVAGVLSGGAIVTDAAHGLQTSEAVSVVARTLSLLALGVTGGVIQRIESERDTALLRSATEDPVTGLLNVRAFYDGLRELRDQGQTFSILLADVVGMKQLNEEFGHPIGTEALRALGHAIRHSVKRDDLVSRIGGDEVAIALVGADPQGARAAARRLGRVLADEELILPDGSSLEVHVYFGIATYPENASDEVRLLRAANHAVDAARNQGPDQVAVSTDVPEPLEGR